MTDMQIHRVTKYDSLEGKQIRDIKATDIFNIVGVATGTGAATAVATGTTSATQHLYPYIWVVGSDDPTFHTFALVAGTNTVAYLPLIGAGTACCSNKIVSIPEAPIHRLGISDTYRVIVVNAATGFTYYSTLVCKREPQLSDTETQIT